MKTAQSSSLPSVKLSWNGPKGVIFQIFRANISGKEDYSTPYAAVGPSIFTFVDYDVVRGKTYYYTVKSTRHNDPTNESAASIPVLDCTLNTLKDIE